MLEAGVRACTEPAHAAGPPSRADSIAPRVKSQGDTSMCGKLSLLLSGVVTAALSAGPGLAAAPEVLTADVCVYGATPAGILAAVAIQREGHSAVIVEPGRWIGGMLGAGIKPVQDCSNFEAVGGMARKLMLTLGTDKYSPDMSLAQMRNLAHTVSPRDVRADFLELLNEHGVRVVYDHRMQECLKQETRIEQAVFELAPFDAYGCPPARAAQADHLRVRAKLFIDASYEGELMARAGVSWRAGREARAEFNEEHAGVCRPEHLTPIGPFVEPGNAASGLLPLVEDDHGKPLGAADDYTQAYNYRYYTTTDPRYRAPIEPPEDYEPQDYELLGRYVAWLVENTPDEKALMDRLGKIFPGDYYSSSGEHNYYRGQLFSMAPLGISRFYPAGDYATKARVWKQHQDYTRGVHHFLSTDPRVLAAFRERTARLGLDKRHHPDTHGWPHQLYIRVARRMCGRYTLTEHDVYNRTQVEDSIGLAQYGVDTYPARRIWLRRDGRVFVAVEGAMFVGRARGPTGVPYPIPYRAVTPKAEECTNLLVPVCFSATHGAYASARMEPVFMILGESVGMAAVEALDGKVPVQQIDVMRLQERLAALGQVLRWPPAEHEDTSR